MEDLPPPLGPTSATTSPAVTSKEVWEGVDSCCSRLALSGQQPCLQQATGCLGGQGSCSTWQQLHTAISIEPNAMEEAALTWVD